MDYRTLLIYRLLNCNSGTRNVFKKIFLFAYCLQPCRQSLKRADKSIPILGTALFTEYFCIKPATRAAYAA